MMVEIIRVLPAQLPTPSAWLDGLTLSALGSLELLQRPLLAVFSSVQCPAALILKAHDTARQLSAKGQAVISGFQSPVEKEMLTVLLRGKSPIVICPARGLEGMRIPAGWKPGLEAGRLLLLSPFPADLRRVTAEQAERRNRLVFSLAERALIVHAAPGGKLEQLCQEVSAAGVNLFTYDSVYNQNILSLGAQIWAI
jgi:predicted Rossmann fold nucleotide-binding protein DprA/Smf involved in DNA uptake